jgi:DNA primase
MNDTEAIKGRLPIEQLIGSYLPLKKAGRIYKANCPFHQEKTPSFTVNPERAIFKCFGCGEGGDIFDFVMKLEGLSFPEALQLLADRAGVILTPPEPARGSAGNGGPHRQTAAVNKSRLFELNQHAAKVWHALLTRHPKAEVAREYLRSRGLTEETWKTFQIGYAPPGDGTAQALRAAGYTPGEIREAGDPARFQSRITFPVTDVTGRVIGFTGRLLEHPEDPRPDRSGRQPMQTQPKYWNTPETALFVKSKAIYALHVAKRAIQDEDTALLAEGQMDVVTLHQFGYQNAVASSGTALTAQQLQLLRRFTGTVTFAYDRDKAGIDATERGISLALANELVPYVITTPFGKDPAECLTGDPEAWAKAYRERLPYMEWLINQAVAGFADLSTLSPVQVRAAVKRLLPWLAQIPDAVEQNEWLRVIAGKLRTSDESIREALARFTAKNPPSTRTASPTTPAAPTVPAGRTVAVATPAAASLEHYLELVAGLAVAFPGIIPVIREEIAALQPLAITPFLTAVLPLILTVTDPGDTTDLLATLPDESSRTVLSVRVEELLQPYIAQELDTGGAAAEALILLRRIRSDRLEAAKVRLSREIQAAQQEQDQEKVRALFKELQNMV